MAVAELEPSTQGTYGGYIRRTILPALRPIELRKVRGPVLDTFYARLRRCGNLACTGRPFIEHRAFPGVVIEASGSHSAWRQAAAAIREAVASGRMAPGQQLPSVRELAAQYRLPVSALRRALEELATEGVIAARQGRRAVVAASPGPVPVPRPRADDTGHDCARAGCQPHRSPTSPRPATVAAVIAAARDREMDLLSIYVWLAAVTGARRGELCGLQWTDVDLEAGLVHIAFSYLVRAGQKMRKDTKTHQDRTLAIDAVTIAVLAERKQHVQAVLADAGVMHAPTAYVFTSDPDGRTPWNPDWVTHKVAEVAHDARVSISVKSLRHYTASQLLAGGIDLRNTAARLGHGGGARQRCATTLTLYPRSIGVLPPTSPS